MPDDLIAALRTALVSPPLTLTASDGGIAQTQTLTLEHAVIVTRQFVMDALDALTLDGKTHCAVCGWDLSQRATDGTSHRSPS